MLPKLIRYKAMVWIFGMRCLRPVTHQLYEGVTHEFFGTYTIEPKAAQAAT
ncbi:hypothetical protein [Spirosoma sp.]|uniref:hypothetical protein n=1 Tax=Spirosoma sp. TaxID=1899569 RepID=UPI003B3BE846